MEETTKKSGRQPSPAEYLLREREEMPAWLEECTADKPVCVSNLLKSRILFNPGAGDEGAPIKVFNTAHAVHVFVYVDYWFTKEEIDKALSDDAFRGYHILREQEVCEKELISRAPVYHLTAEEWHRVKEDYSHAQVPTDNKFGLLKIYERDAEYTDEHGAKRFAVLYLGADAIATYDVLFGNLGAVPFASVVDSYSFCGAYDHFARGSLIEKIARRTNSLPHYLLCAHHCEGWDGYCMLRHVGGSGTRFLWKRQDLCEESEIPTLDEELLSIIEFVDDENCD